MGTLNDFYRENERLRQRNFQDGLNGLVPPNFHLGGKSIPVLRNDTGYPVALHQDLQGNVLYRFYDKRGRTLYIGITRDLFIRCQGSRTWKPGAGHRYKPWWSEVCLATVDGNFRTRQSLAEAESRAIQNEAPLHNIVDQFTAQTAISGRRGVRVHGETC